MCLKMSNFVVLKFMLLTGALYCSDKTGSKTLLNLGSNPIDYISSKAY